MASRTRRPERALYVPRAKRSQTTPPSSTSSSYSTTQESKKPSKKSLKTNSESIDENNSSEELSSSPNSSSAVNCKEIFDFSASDEDRQFEDPTGIEVNMADSSVPQAAASDEKPMRPPRTFKEKPNKGEKLVKVKRVKNPKTKSASTKIAAETSNEVEHENDEQLAVNKEDDDWDTL